MESFKILEFHHLYWGLLLIIAGLLVKKHKKLSYFLLILGAIITSDDIIQHFILGWSLLSDLFHWGWYTIFGDFWPFGNL